MKKMLIVLTLIMLVLCSCGKKAQVEEKTETDLVVYSYDSFVSYGLGKAIIPIFEEKYNCKVMMQSVGDAGQMLMKVVQEKENPVADVVVGISAEMLHKVEDEKILQPFKPSNHKNLKPGLAFDKNWYLTPFDYGYLAFVYDSEVIKDPPTSFGEIQNGIWKDKIIMIDPRTSSPGLSMLNWTVAQFGKFGYGHFWKAVKENVLTVAPSWDEAYSMFQAGEAPIVLSYATSPAYHIMYDKTNRYKAFIPNEGGYRQIEGVGIVKDCKNKQLAEKFVEFMLTEEVQNQIPLTQWMMPAVENIELPQCFSGTPEATKDVSKKLSAKMIKENQERWIKKWVSIMTK